MSRRKRVKNPAKSTKFDQSNEVRAIARERVGTVKPSQPILAQNHPEKAQA